MSNRLKIDAKILDDLYILKDNLNYSDKYDSSIAKFCFLGEKDNIIDCFEETPSEDGCGNIPYVNRDDIYNAMMKLLEKDRVIAGGAIIPAPSWECSEITSDVKEGLCEIKKSFKDPKNVLWIVLNRNECQCFNYIKKGKGLYVNHLKRPFINKKSSFVLRYYTMLKDFDDLIRKGSHIPQYKVDDIYDLSRNIRRNIIKEIKTQKGRKWIEKNLSLLEEKVYGSIKKEKKYIKVARKPKSKTT